MNVLHLLIAAILVIPGTSIPLFNIPINTNGVIRSFIGGPDDGEETLFEDGRKRERDGNEAASTPFPFPILSGISRVVGALNNSTLEGVRNVAIAAFPQIFRATKDQVGFRTTQEKVSPEILESFRIHANADAADKAMDKKASIPTTERTMLLETVTKVAEAISNSTIDGIRNLA